MKTLDYSKIRRAALDEIAQKMNINRRGFKNWAEFKRWDTMQTRSNLIECSVIVTLRHVLGEIE